MKYQRFSPRQALTLTWWKRPEFADYDGILCDGSIRSGKTVSMAVGFILWSMYSFNNESFAICGRTIESLHGKKVAIFATAGTYPDSQAARDYLDNAAALLPEDSECLGTFISQGRVHSFHIGKRSEHAKLVHPMTPDRLARLQEAEKHPNEDDFRRAGEWAVSMAEKAQA